MSQGDLLARITERLTDAGIPYMVVGSLASSFHGQPRTTRDLDIVIEPTAESIRRFVDGLPRPDFYADAEAAVEAFARRTSFNIVEAATGWKVDLLIPEDRPFSRVERSRRIRVQILGTDVHVATAEDTIIAKLEWAKRGESDRQLRDVVGILAVSGDVLDRAYVEHWAAALDVTDTWKEALALSSAAS